jgi:hypothetical protein
MTGSADVARLTIRLREPSPRRLRAKLADIVQRAHAAGMQTAAISAGMQAAALPRRAPTQDAQQTATISLPEGVGGTVTIADVPARLRAFAVEVSDMAGPQACIELDDAGTVYDLTPLPAGSSTAATES